MLRSRGRRAAPSLDGGRGLTMTQHLWSGRFDSAPDPAAFDFGVSFPFDRRLFEDDVTGSLAWADALVACGALSSRRWRTAFAMG